MAVATRPLDQAGQRELVRLLEAVRDATAAITDLPDSPAVARWLRYRAACYRQIATHHLDDVACPSELAAAAAEDDDRRAHGIDERSFGANRGKP